MYIFRLHLVHRKAINTRSDIQRKRIQVGQARELKDKCSNGTSRCLGSMLPIGNQPEKKKSITKKVDASTMS